MEISAETYGTITGQAQMKNLQAATNYSTNRDKFRLKVRSNSTDYRINFPGDDPKGEKRPFMKEFDNHDQVSATSGGSSGGNFHNSGAQSRRAQTCGLSRFRYVVCFMILIGNALHLYGSSTLFIAAIRMISKDVFVDGVTQLRAKHMALDPLSVAGTNAALEGTCPVEATYRSFGQISNENATLISQQERAAMLSETAELLAQISKKLATGQLVDWSMNQRGIMFTAETIGCLLFAVPLSRLGLAYGSKIIILVALTSSAIRASLFPLVAGNLPFWFVFLWELILGGLGYGTKSVVYPITAAWLLPDEAGAFIAFYQLSGVIGDSLTNLISSQMMASKIDWSFCFYLPAILLWMISLVWYIYGADRPEKSKFVSENELKILKDSVSNRNDSKKMEMISLGDSVRCVCSDEEKINCPSRIIIRKPNWLTILKCPTLWSLNAVAFAYHWEDKTVTLWPTYFANIVHIATGNIGLILGLKGVLSLIYGGLFACFTRKLAINRPFNISITAYRRWGLFFALIIHTVSIMFMVVFDCWPLMLLMRVILMPIENSLNMISFQQLPLDLSPEDSGLLASYVRIVSIGDIISLPACSWILSFASNPVLGDRLTWRLVWLLGLGLKIIGCIAFLSVARAEPKSYSKVRVSGPCKTKQRLLDKHLTTAHAG